METKRRSRRRWARAPTRKNESGETPLACRGQVMGRAERLVSPGPGVSLVSIP